MAKRPPPPPSPDAKPYLSLVALDDLGPADRVARQIIDARRDLLPSVARIMDAELHADATYMAIELFRASLEGTTDPHRDPRQAIATASARHAEAGRADGPPVRPAAAAGAAGPAS